MRWTKDPSDTLNYIFDFAPLVNGRGDSDWLDRTSSPVETISTHTITVDSPGPTVVTSSITESSTSVTVRLSGGTAGQTYKIVCQITTNKSQTKEITALLYVTNQ